MSGQAGSEQKNEGRARRGHQAQALAAWALLLSAPMAALAQKPAPELTACVAANRQAATDLLQARESEIRRHALHAVLVSRLQGLSGSFNPLKATAARAPRNLAECEKVTEALTAGREQLERIVGTPEQLAECVAGNQAGYGEMQATLLSLQSTGKASVPALETASSRLALLRPAMNREGLTLADCRQLATEVQAERLQVQRLVPAAPQQAVAPGAGGLAGVLAGGLAGAPPSAGAASAAAATNAAAATACRAAQTRDYNEVAQAYAQFVSAGPLAQEWMATLQSLSERLTRLSQSIATPGAPGWECEGIHRALAQARSDLAKLKR